MAKRGRIKLVTAGPDDPIYKGGWGIITPLGSSLKKMRAQQPAQDSDSLGTKPSTGATKATSATKTPDEG